MPKEPYQIFAQRDLAARELRSACNDESLVDAMKAGEFWSLAALYERHSPSVYGLCLELVKDQREAEALLEEVFWKLWHARLELQCPKDGVLECLLGFASREAAAQTKVVGEMGNDTGIAPRKLAGRECRFEPHLTEGSR
jgi:hypothetical protein